MKTRNKRQSSEHCVEKKKQRRGTQIIESKKERTERGKLGRSGRKRERRREGAQSCRVLNEAKKTHHLATPHTLPDCHPKSVHNWPANCHKMQWKGGEGEREKAAQAWLRGQQQFGSGNACQGQAHRELSLADCPKILKRGDQRETQRETVRGKEAGKQAGQWLQKDCCLCLKDKWASAGEGEGAPSTGQGHHQHMLRRATLDLPRQQFMQIAG